MRLKDGRVVELDFGAETEALAHDDAVILAVPSHAAAALVPGLTVPQGHRAIANAHFRIDVPPGMPPMMGIINGTTEWVFAFDGRLSVTISNADRLMDVPRAMLAQTIWQEVSRVPGIAAELPPWQIVRERRATFAATPEENAKRAAARTQWDNLVLAGDWTATGLPATLGERGALRQSRGGGRDGGRRDMTPDRAQSRSQHRCGDAGVAGLPEARRRMVLRARGRRHHSVRIRAAPPLSRRAGRRRAGRQDRCLSAADTERAARRLAVVPGRRLRPEREREGLFRAEDDRRSHRCAAHGAGAAGDPRARRRGGRQHLHQAAAGAVRLRAVARRAGDADRDHAVSEMVSVPSRQDLVLEPHCHRAAAGADGAEAAARNPKNVRIDELFLDPPATLGPAPKAPQQNAALFWFFRAADDLLRLGEPVFPKMEAQARDRHRGGLGRRAAQRRGRTRRDLPGDGQQRDDVRRAGLSAGPSAAGDRAAGDREAAGRARTRPICSLASRRSGTPGSPVMRCWKPATTRRCGA